MSCVSLDIIVHKQIKTEYLAYFFFIFLGTFFRLQQQGKLTKEMLEEAGSREDDDEFLSDLDDLSVDDSENDDCDEGDDSKNDDWDERKKDSSSCEKE